MAGEQVSKNNTQHPSEVQQSKAGGNIQPPSNITGLRVQLPTFIKKSTTAGIGAVTGEEIPPPKTSENGTVGSISASLAVLLFGVVLLILFLVRKKCHRGYGRTQSRMSTRAGNHTEVAPADGVYEEVKEDGRPSRLTRPGCLYTPHQTDDHTYRHVTCSAPACRRPLVQHASYSVIQIHAFPSDELADRKGQLPTIPCDDPAYSLLQSPKMTPDDSACSAGEPRDFLVDDPGYSTVQSRTITTSSGDTVYSTLQLDTVVIPNV
ncbi:uncharacterized protein LOC121719578 [Alosa sapidissima]|uniref:uncharacterized protein LOC121719578 n=1 Tax=Alosa sapidissima TaxID=34773 RepID=UPI001C08D4EC|nr:uncharacterized protein LOC121719578 [Alosa sapidissima]